MEKESKVLRRTEETHSHFALVGGARCFNDNPFPVRVTVERVAEAVTEVRYVTWNDGEWCLTANLRRAGFSEGQRVEVTIRPLPE